MSIYRDYNDWNDIRIVCFIWIWWKYLLMGFFLIKYVFILVYMFLFFCNLMIDNNDYYEFLNSLMKNLKDLKKVVIIIE